MVLLTVRGGGEERNARQEVRRVEQLVALLADEAVNRQVEIGLQLDEHGYRVMQWDGSEWQPLGDSAILRPHMWSGGVAVTLQAEGRPVDLVVDTQQESREPQVVFLSSGSVTPFELEIVAANGYGERLRVHLTAQSERAPIEGMP
jgi:hypothetical protein